MFVWVVTNKVYGFCSLDWWLTDGIVYSELTIDDHCKLSLILKSRLNNS